MPCPHIQTCELFPELTVNSALKVWQVFYCEGDYSQCVRFQNSSRGTVVPITLLPNGKTMDQRILGGRGKSQPAPAAQTASSETLDLDGDLPARQSVAEKQPQAKSTLSASDSDVESTFYLRIKAEPDAQAEIIDRSKAILFDLKVDVDATISKRHDEFGHWIILITDQTKEMNLYRAILRIEELKGVEGKVKCIALEKLSQLVVA